MYFKINTHRRYSSLLLFWMLTLLSSLSAREETGFALSLNLAESLINDTEWLISNSPAIEKNETARGAEIPLTSAAPIVRRPKLDFDPILLLFKMTPDTARLDATQNMWASLDESAAHVALPHSNRMVSNIQIIHSRAGNEHSPADSFTINAGENVTLLLGGTFTHEQLPDWLGVWNKLVFNFSQPDRGECQFYFQQFANGLLILGNNPVSAPQKIYLVVQEITATKSAAELPGGEMPLLEPLKSVIRVKYKINQPGRCAIEVIDLHQNRIRLLDLQENATTGEKIAQFWDGRDAAGVTVANGIYFYQISARPADDAKIKMVVLR